MINLRMVMVVTMQLLMDFNYFLRMATVDRRQLSILIDFNYILRMVMGDRMQLQMYSASMIL